MCQSKAILLGELLPPLRLCFHDKLGNVITAPESQSPLTASGAGPSILQDQTTQQQQQPKDKQPDTQAQQQQLGGVPGVQHVQLEVLSGSLEAGGSVVEDLTAVAELVGGERHWDVHAQLACWAHLLHISRSLLSQRILVMIHLYG